MSNKLKKKAIAVVFIEILCLVFLGIFLTQMQTNLAVANQKENTEEKLALMQEAVDSAQQTALDNEASYDELYQSKADSAAYIAKKDKNFEYTDAKMSELAKKMNVSNMLIIDDTGKQIAKGSTSPADFSAARFNQLTSVFTNDTPGAAFTVTFGDKAYRYYASKIDDTHALVIENDPEELVQLENSVYSWDSVLSKINVGLTGFTFAVSSRDYTFLYYPQEDMIGKDSLIAGLDVNKLEDNNYAWLTINGERFYCGVKKLEDHNAYVICAVPNQEMISSRNITVAIILFIFFMIMTLLSIYALLTLADQEKNQDKVTEDYIHRGILTYNKGVMRKIGALSVLGLLVIFVISFYMQTLFSLSRRSMSNNNQVADVQETLNENKAEAELLTTQYNRRYLNKCQIAAYILSSNPQLWTKEDLAELTDIMNIEYMMIYDKDGKEVVTNASYVNFEISGDQEDASYDFQKLLLGKDYVIQEAQVDETTGQYLQLIGASLVDEDGNADGFVQIALVPDKQEKAVAATSLSSVLKRVKASAGGFAFAVNKETSEFSWYPEDRMIGKNALEYGLEERQLRDQFCDFIKIDNVDYYASSVETDSDYIYIATPKDRMNRTSLPIALASTAASLVCVLLLLWVLAVAHKEEKEEERIENLPPAENEDEIEEEREEAREEEEKAKGPMISVNMPDGTKRKTEAAASRWANISIGWGDKTPEQQVGSILRGFISVLAIVICLSILFKNSIFGEDSIFLYVINGQWERNVNIFSITACLMIICVADVAVMIIQEILKMLSKSLGARGETVCRLLRNLIKYVGIIAALYYCFALFGVDTATLLASAGILSLVIGLGAKELVSDILAGLFIIFEGEFQVGDIVTIGDWRGTVQEIGIRTTKIASPGGDVKVISNSGISGVINMTKERSYSVCDVGIEYGESLERVESILAKELPEMAKRIPTIKDGPFYKGVCALGDNSVNIRIVAQCEEKDRAQLGRDMNREMKILFDKYDINIPFPQVVINQPKEYVQATEWDKLRADAFNEAQKQLSKGIENEQEGK